MSLEDSSVQSRGATVLSEEASGVYAALFNKINLSPVSELAGIDIFQSLDALSEVSVDERVTAAVSVFLNLLKQTPQKIERLDKVLLDEHIASLDRQIGRQLDAVMHHPDFQRVESTWRGVKSLIDQTDFRQNVRIELLDVSKDHLVQDFEDAPEIAQSGLYLHTYTQEYDTPGGEPIAAAISNYEFDRRPQDIALLRNISKVARVACTCIPTRRSTTPRVASRLRRLSQTTNSIVGLRTSRCCAIFPKWPPPRTCRLWGPSAQPSSAKRPWRRWPRSKTSATTLIVPNTSSGSHSVTVMMRVTSA